MKPGMQIMFLFLKFWSTQFVSGQEPVSLTRDDLIPWTDREILYQLKYPVGKE